ncbi:MAG TPA: VWA domain-containing protein [Bacteroidales bacterium]|nr:VWA domain-containing protein [Bacteroidales bacterium]
MFYNLEFANPWWLLLLTVLPLLIIYYVLRKRKLYPTINFSNTENVQNIHKTNRQRLFFIPFLLRLLALLFFILAMARPQGSISRQNIDVEGIDIIMAMDISGSMLARDFKPDRLESAKKVASEFIKGRPNDRIGLVAFSGEVFLQCPLTIDHLLLDTLFQALYSGMIEDGTAIGDGLALAVYHLKKSQAISKVIILITDGVNNRGSMDPITAAEIAALYGIRVYTIGVGSMGMAPFPVQTPLGIQFVPMEVQIDETLCTKIANITGGKYFRAQNENKLREIYKEIDQMEKSKINVSNYNKKTEHFLPFVIIGAILLLIEILFKYTVFKTIP